MGQADIKRLSTGIDGLDTILSGGFLRGRSYMIHGQAGAGKTILSYHFLNTGLDDDETALFINLEEELDDLKSNLAAFGFDVDRIHFLDLSPTADVFTDGESYDVFTASAVEQEPFTAQIVETVRDLEPDRVVVDPLTQFWYLTSGEYDFRKQVVGFMRFLKNVDATVLFTTQQAKQVPTEDLQFISDGTVVLENTPNGRRITVPKFRGSSSQRGDHAVRITDDGMVVYPELMPGQQAADFAFESVSSGVSEIDNLLNGGIERGTVSIFSGPTGVGKTTLGTQFLKAAAQRGERSVVYLFEENRRTFTERSESVNIPVTEMVDRGTLHIEEVEALEQSPQEFAHQVKAEVEDNDTSVVMIDGIAGYRLTLRGEESQVVQRLHALGRYLKNQGVTSIFIDETPDVVGSFHATHQNISYLADTIVFLRHLELQGELQKAIGVLKKRTSSYERTLRQYQITPDGIVVGEPLTAFRGILSGTPERRNTPPNHDEL